jgi:hypothetical protein
VTDWGKLFQAARADHPKEMDRVIPVGLEDYLNEVGRSVTEWRMQEARTLDRLVRTTLREDVQNGFVSVSAHSSTLSVAAATTTATTATTAITTTVAAGIYTQSVPTRPSRGW